MYIFYALLGAYLITLLVVTIVKKVQAKKKGAEDVKIYENENSNQENKE